MFLDERGWRGQVVRLLGVLGGLFSAAAVTVIVIGAFGFLRVSPPVASPRPVLASHGPVFASHGPVTATVLDDRRSRQRRDRGGRDQRPLKREVLAGRGGKAAF